MVQVLGSAVKGDGKKNVYGKLTTVTKEIVPTDQHRGYGPLVVLPESPLGTMVEESGDRVSAAGVRLPPDLCTVVRIGAALVVSRELPRSPNLAILNLFLCNPLHCLIACWQFVAHIFRVFKGLSIRQWHFNCS